MLENPRAGLSVSCDDSSNGPSLVGRISVGVPMSLMISDFPAVEARAVELGSRLPEGLVFLPTNFANAAAGDELRFLSEASTIAKILRGSGVSITRLSGRDHHEAFIHNRNQDWALPMIYIGSELLKQSPDMVTLALSALQDYVLEKFKGLTSSQTITAEVVIEDRRRKQTKRISYEGPPDGFREFTAMVKKLARK